MRILYIGFDVEGVGGIATYTRHQVRALRALGYSLYVVSLNKQEKRFAPGYGDRHVPFAGRADVVASLARLVLAPPQPFDAVVLNHVYLAPFGLLARWRFGTPFTLNVYNIDILEKLPAVREFAFARADLVIADCRYTIEHMPRFHDRVPPTGLLYDPVDTGFFKPIAKADAKRELARRFNLADLPQRFVIVTVAHLAGPPNNNKGHRQTIEALRQLRDPRLLYLVVGDGPDRPAVEAYAREQGVAEQVKFLGLVDQDALPFLYAGADVAVLVSRAGKGLGEGVPLGMIEASSCGTAVIGGNQDGSIEAIDTANPNGFAIDPTRSDELAQRLRQLADDPALCATMGRNGAAMVDNVFRFEKFTAQQGDLLRRVIPG